MSLWANRKLTDLLPENRTLKGLKRSDVQRYLLFNSRLRDKVTQPLILYLFICCSLFILTDFKLLSNWNISKTIQNSQCRW